MTSHNVQQVCSGTLLHRSVDKGCEPYSEDEMFIRTHLLLYINSYISVENMRFGFFGGWTYFTKHSGLQLDSFVGKVRTSFFVVVCVCCYLFIYSFMLRSRQFFLIVPEVKDYFLNDTVVFS